MRRLLPAFLFPFLLLLAPLAQAQEPPLADAAALVEPLLEDLPDRAIVVGIVDADGVCWVRGFGRVPGTERPPRGDDVFEIGSLTKAFTGILLADMTLAGEVELDHDPWRYLPREARPPADSPAQGITLLHLTTHHSGLPRLPTNLVMRSPLDPYADYGAEALYAFTRDPHLERDPGAGYEYSNLGAGLLGHALALRAEASYEDLVRERVCEPLGLGDTRVDLSGPFGERLVGAFGQFGTHAPPWNLASLVAAGGLRSTVDDLLRFVTAALAANEEAEPRALRALDLAMRPQAQAGGGTQIGLGWHLRAAEGGAQVWHNGGTGGYATFLGLDRERGVGVVVLANGAIYGEVTGAGFRLLDLLAARAGGR
jgi:CubicO group peptidase (beta-lactamase class C family)